MIRVEAPSRLHFGLLSLPGPPMWPDSEGNATIPARQFGGAGLMVERPGIALTVAVSTEWSAIGPCADRALQVAKKVCEGLAIRQPFNIKVDRCPPEHVGLGTGTQLSLAVARGISLAAERASLSVLQLAKLAGRGRRSAIGIHGFDQGGFLVEAGKREHEAISPLIARVAFPEDWSILLVTPRHLQGDHGPREMEAFQQLQRLPPALDTTERLCRLVLMGMLPALAEHDLDAFGDAIYKYNRCAGEMFKPWQGDVYSHPLLAKIIDLLREAGVKGAGHSSWGPAVFGITNRSEAAEVVEWLKRQRLMEPDEILITTACNDGATATSN